MPKKSTIRDEVWKNYFKSHPIHRSYRTNIFTDYEDLRIAIGNETTIGKNTIRLEEATDARTLEEEENRGSALDELIYDTNIWTFIHNNVQDFLYQSSSYGYSILLLPSDTINLDVPQGRKKRNRSEFEEKTTSSESNHNQHIL
ncbi:uncharacterized protein LOC125370127 [Ricinus communis]|uniref:uncharacterized protein LOC125370127 n=1 Tax=Ricinus communis TaxID=3988 RepID=UPI00201AA287|nr:uncharacterized protein LOC125370127 [Ricinus communis]